MRRFLSKSGLTEDQFKKLRLSDPQWDEALDNEQRRIGRLPTPSVIESRLAAFFIEDALKVRVTCDENERTERLIARAREVDPRDGSTEAFRRAFLEQERRRAETDRLLFKQHYGIDDYLHHSHYDLTVDNSGPNGLEECLTVIENVYLQYLGTPRESLRVVK